MACAYHSDRIVAVVLFPPVWSPSSTSTADIWSVLWSSLDCFPFLGTCLPCTPPTLVPLGMIPRMSPPPFYRSLEQSILQRSSLYAAGCYLRVVQSGVILALSINAMVRSCWWKFVCLKSGWGSCRRSISMYWTLGMCTLFPCVRFMDQNFFPKLPLGFNIITLRGVFEGEMLCTDKFKDNIKTILVIDWYGLYCSYGKDTVF